MNEQLIEFHTAKLAKEKGFDVGVLHFYVKHHKCKVFGIDEKGRHFPATNIPKKLYTVGQDAVLDIENVYFAPTQSLLQKWLREVHNLYVDITKSGKGEFDSDIIYDVFYGWSITEIDSTKELCPGIHVGYNTYEEALELGLIEALKLIK